MKEDRAKELLKKKKEFFQELLLLVNEQKEYIEDERTDELLQSLLDRQDLQQAIDDLDKELEGLNEWENHGELMQEIRSIVAAIKDLDSDNEALAGRKMEDYRTKIRNISAAKTQTKGYMGAVTAEPMYFDRKN